MALWIRNLSHFGVNLEWHGDNRVLVTAKEDGVISVAKTLGGRRDLESIAKLMRDVEDRLHRDATAMG